MSASQTLWISARIFALTLDGPATVETHSLARVRNLCATRWLN